MRYEVAIETAIAFHTRRPPYEPMFPPAEDVVIKFEGRRFVWHATHTDPAGQECWPTVTTVIENGNAYDPERHAMERFLSVVSYHTGIPIEVISICGAGWPSEMDRPVANSLRRGPGNHIHEAPLELVAEGDERLMRVMGYYRDGLATASPFFRFLAFYNALDVACEDYDGGLGAWLNAEDRHLYHWGDQTPPPDDLWIYVREEGRNAIAHAVRDPQRGEEIDPNDPDERSRFYRDSRLLQQLVQDRVRERWGPYAVWARRRNQAD